MFRYIYVHVLPYIRLFTRHVLSANSTLKSCIKSMRENFSRNPRESWNLLYSPECVQFICLHFHNFGKLFCIYLWTKNLISYNRNLYSPLRLLSSWQSCQLWDHRYRWWCRHLFDVSFVSSSLLSSSSTSSRSRIQCPHSWQ